MPVAVSSANTADGDSSPTCEEVARLTFSYYEARGFKGGSAEEDWYNAERELTVRTAAAGKS